MSNPRLLSDDEFIGVFSGPAQVSINFTPLGGGQFNGTYVATRAGYYSLSVRLGGLFNTGAAQPILVVLPSAECAAASLARGEGLTLATTSIQAGFVVVARDKFGNQLPGTALRLQAAFDNASLGVFTADTGARFQVMYTPFTSGVFDLDIALDGWPIFGGRRKTLVRPAPLRSACSYAAGAALTLRTAGIKAIFTVVLKDCFGQQRSLEAGQEIAVQVSTGREVGRLASTYYAGIFEDVITVTEDFEALDFSSASALPDEPRSWVSARWSGRVWTTIDDTYSFYAKLRDPSERIKLWLDNVLLIDLVVRL
jgi:hypothetical protein